MANNVATTTRAQEDFIIANILAPWIEFTSDIAFLIYDFRGPTEMPELIEEAGTEKENEVPQRFECSNCNRKLDIIIRSSFPDWKCFKCWQPFCTTCQKFCQVVASIDEKTQKTCPCCHDCRTKYNLVIIKFD